MKTMSFLCSILFLFTFTFNINAQDNNSEINGNATEYVEPIPSQGSSDGAVYNTDTENFITDESNDFTFSYDSESDQINVSESVDGSNEIIPMLIGTEDFELKGYNDFEDNSIFKLSDFYYAMVLESRNDAWSWRANWDWTGFQEQLTNLANDGKRIENIDTYGKNVFNYGGTWTTDNVGWSWSLNYSVQNDFVNILNGWTSGSPRKVPIDFAIHPSGGTRLYGAVAREDNSAYAWTFNVGSVSALIDWVNEQYNSSRRIIDIEVYPDNNGNSIFGGISIGGNYQQQVAVNQSYNSFQDLNNQFTNDGYRLSHYVKTYSNGNFSYTGIWNNDGIGGAWVYNYNNFNDFLGAVANHTDNNYNPVMINVSDADWAVSVDDDGLQQVNSFNLKQNYPNPFNPATTINYSIPEVSNVVIKIYDVLGKEVAALVNEEKPAGNHTVNFDASGLTSGIYFYRIKANSFVETKSMVLMK